MKIVQILFLLNVIPAIASHSRMTRLQKKAIEMNLRINIPDSNSFLDYQEDLMERRQVRKGNGFAVGAYVAVVASLFIFDYVRKWYHPD